MSNKTKYLLIGSALGLSILAGGCVVRSGVGVQTTAYYEEPTLAYVGPGVWVITDYSEPVFYSDNYYWAYRGGYWYRSSIYTGGWIRVYSVPHRVRGIHNPHYYVRYRPPHHVQTRPAPRVRDHRYSSPGAPGRATPPPRSNTRVPAQRGTPSYRTPPAPGRAAPPARPAANTATKKAPPPRQRSKSKSRDHR
jgi:hypothetical protein